ncbi:hypothetical protein AB0I60_34690 [Actinosynnema sp. NPDC050436]|uniref:hypothetical protein n=1 Tax=Actinosynnema sp. NPDC050436 TaxID=3155659 RepID=UPI0033FE1799
MDAAGRNRPQTVQGLDDLADRLPTMVEGDRLVHTDLHGHQIRIDDGNSVRVVDWGMPVVGKASLAPTARLRPSPHKPKRNRNAPNENRHTSL